MKRRRARWSTWWRKNNRRYGGYIIHIGVVCAFVGIVASSFFRTEVKQKRAHRAELQLSVAYD